MNPSRIAGRGFSVLELLVSLAIGLLVTMAAVQLFVTNQLNFQLQRGLSDVSENGRFALDYIARQARQVSYVPTWPNIKVWEPIVVGVADLPTGTSGLAGIVSANNNPALPAPGTGKQGGIGPSDSVLLQYYTSVATMDCEGAAVPAGSVVLARFFLRADTVADTGSALVCEGGYHSGLTDAALQNFSTGSSGGAVLLSSVDNFQVLIGLANTTAGEPAYARRYLTIQEYADLGTPRPPISALKFGLLVSSVDKAGNLIGVAQGVSVLDQAIAGTSIPVDNRVRRLYANTVTLRNVL